MTKLNLGAGAHELEGFVNRGPENDGWRFEDGLGDYADGSVEAVTCSHSLMFLPIEHWLPLFTDIARVLAPGGVLRITEDSTDDLKSERFGGFDGAVVLTSRKLVGAFIDLVGLERHWPTDHDPLATAYKDDSLVQQWHGAMPKVFHIEAVKR